MCRLEVDEKIRHVQIREASDQSLVNHVSLSDRRTLSCLLRQMLHVLNFDFGECFGRTFLCNLSELNLLFPVSISMHL